MDQTGLLSQRRLGLLIDESPRDSSVDADLDLPHVFEVELSLGFADYGWRERDGVENRRLRSWE